MLRFKRTAAIAATGLALSAGAAALSMPAASARTLPLPVRPHSVSVSGTALCGTRFLPSGVIRYQPARSVVYRTRSEVQFAPVQFNGRYFLNLHQVPPRGEQAVATVSCRDRTQFSHFEFINGFDRFQIHNLAGVTRVVRGTMS